MTLDVFKPCNKCGFKARIHRVQWVEKLKISILYKCSCGCKFTYFKHISEKSFANEDLGGF